MLRIKRLNFAEWKAENPDLVVDESPRDCPKCGGTGESNANVAVRFIRVQNVEQPEK